MKEKILSTALELFSQRGFEAVSISMISDSLGISKGALYKHYESKRDIFNSIIKRMEENDSKLSQDFDMPDDIFENMPEAYKNTELENLFSFSFSMFVYWTEDDFASRFRRMISIERFNSPEINGLFQQYLGSGPLSYVEDIFSSHYYFADSKYSAKQMALDFYAPIFMLIELYDGAENKLEISKQLKEHIENFSLKLQHSEKITYPRSEKYCVPELMKLIMGPNPLKLTEELLENNLLKPGSVVCDLGSGNGLTSVFLANEYGLKVYASDLWSDPEENALFFQRMGFDSDSICPVKADAMKLPFDKEFFDAVVSVDSYNYFGRDPEYLDTKLLPFVKKGGYIYIAIPGMKKDCHSNLPDELLLSWNAEQLDFMHDKEYWHSIIEQCKDAEIICINEMRSNEEVWRDWLIQENDYAANDRKSMEAGAGKYFNFIRIILRKK